VRWHALRFNSAKARKITLLFPVGPFPQDGSFGPVRTLVMRVRFYSAESLMNITLSLGPLVALIAGILILLMPRLLNYIVALYLIIIGIIGIFGGNGPHHW
jgi:hypothetical protein